MTTSVYHDGERAVQQSAGEVGMADRNGVVIADTILGGARPFLQKQFMSVMASVDAQGAPWSTVLYGEPGFIHADDAASLRIDLAPERRDSSDPFWDNIAANPAVGMLFIELGSRRRYRINGKLERLDQQGIEVAVREAYPNCPKYIQRRHLRGMDGATEPGMLGEGRALEGDVRGIVSRADTIFVASNHAQRGADASHRGGNPGFIQVLEDGLLRIPDYTGNSLFNTFGNLTVDPRVGLCIPDFDGQRMLQILGRARILHGQDDPAKLSGGTGRFWEVEIDRWLLRRVPRRLEWEYLDASPFNPAVAGA
jgi:predicted pyridoxine 5'-phosphate oxidase superfamily flavin-nucleotide-binding protein